MMAPVLVGIPLVIMTKMKNISIIVMIILMRLWVNNLHLVLVYHQNQTAPIQRGRKKNQRARMMRAIDRVEYLS